jgi:hypothetical protein
MWLPKTKNWAYVRTCTSNITEAPCTKRAYQYRQHSEQRNCLNFGQKQGMVHALQLAELPSMVHDNVAAASLVPLLWFNQSFICMYCFFPRQLVPEFCYFAFNQRTSPHDVTIDVLRATFVNPFQQSNAMWGHTFHLSLICMSCVHRFQ